MAAKAKKEKRIECPNCKGVHFKPTKAYKARAEAVPAMIEMIEPYLGWGWGNGVMEGQADMLCPECGAVLAPNGKLTVIQVPVAKKVK